MVKEKKGRSSNNICLLCRGLGKGPIPVGICTRNIVVVTQMSKKRPQKGCVVYVLTVELVSNLLMASCPWKTVWWYLVVGL